MKIVYGAFGLEFSLKFSTRPPKPEDRIGDDALWDKAEGALRAALDDARPPLGAERRATAPSTARRSTSS